MLCPIMFDHLGEGTSDFQHALFRGMKGIQKFRLEGQDEPAEARLQIDNQPQVIGSRGLNVIHLVEPVFIPGKGLNAVKGDDAEDGKREDRNDRDQKEFFLNREVVESSKNSHCGTPCVILGVTRGGVKPEAPIAARWVHRGDEGSGKVLW